MDPASWCSDILFVGWASRPAIRAVHGRATATDVAENGVGVFDVWRREFECGLEVIVWVFPELHWQPLPEERMGLEVYAPTRAVEHVRHHLAVHIDVEHINDEFSWSRRNAEGATPRWLAPDERFVVMRQDDNGNRGEMVRVYTEAQAACIARLFEARGHKQTYWVEQRD